MCDAYEVGRRNIDIFTSDNIRLFSQYRVNYVYEHDVYALRERIDDVI